MGMTNEEREAIQCRTDVEAEKPLPPDLLTSRRFNFASVPAKPLPILRLGEHVVTTAGNLTNLQAPPKGGKSAVIAAIMAAVMDGNRQGADTLGFTAENPHELALIHLDTEQSAYDHDQLVRRALKRSRREDDAPPWLMSYCVTDLTIGERRQALEDAMRIGAEQHGGVFAVLIDGVADLCLSPNDDAEAFALVANLHALTMRYRCGIVTVLHENPGSDSGKTRGHLGSQLERKAETNLRLAKDGSGVSTIWAERARHCHLPREQGLCFQWSEEIAMHVSCGDAGEIRASAKSAKANEEAERSFGANKFLIYGDLVEAIKEGLTLADRTAKLRVNQWLADGIIKKAGNGYHISR